MRFCYLYVLVWACLIPSTALATVEIDFSVNPAGSGAPSYIAYREQGSDTWTVNIYDNNEAKQYALPDGSYEDISQKFKDYVLSNPDGKFYRDFSHEGKEYFEEIDDIKDKDGNDFDSSEYDVPSGSYYDEGTGVFFNDNGTSFDFSMCSEPLSGINVSTCPDHHGLDSVRCYGGVYPLPSGGYEVYYNTTLERETHHNYCAPGIKKSRCTWLVVTCPQEAYNSDGSYTKPSPEDLISSDGPFTAASNATDSKESPSMSMDHSNVDAVSNSTSPRNYIVDTDGNVIPVAPETAEKMREDGVPQDSTPDPKTAHKNGKEHIVDETLRQSMPDDVTGVHSYNSQSGRVTYNKKGGGTYTVYDKNVADQLKQKGYDGDSSGTPEEIAERESGSSDGTGVSVGSGGSGVDGDGDGGGGGDPGEGGDDETQPGEENGTDDFSYDWGDDLPGTPDANFDPELEIPDHLLPLQEEGYVSTWYESFKTLIPFGDTLSGVNVSAGGSFSHTLSGSAGGASFSHTFDLGPIAAGLAVMGNILLFFCTLRALKIALTKQS